MMFECIDKVYPSVSIDTVTGAICSFFDNIGGMPLKSCVSQISGYQEGSGTPSPSNERPLHAFDSASLGKCDNNTALLWSIDNSFNGDVNWNQLVKNGNFADTSNWFPTNSAVLTVENNTLTVEKTQSTNSVFYQAINVTKDHYYYISCFVKPSETANVRFDNALTSPYKQMTAGVMTNYCSIVKASFSYDGIALRFDYSGGVGSTIDVENIYITDLTSLFERNPSIADYIYNLEQTTAGAGVAFFKSLYPDDYYAYNAGTKQLIGDTLATFTFGQDIYQGSIDWKRGVVVGTHKIKSIDSSSPINHGEGTNVFYINDFFDMVDDTETTDCNYLIRAEQNYYTIDNVQTYMEDKAFTCAISINRLFIKNTDWSSLSDFLTWLGSGHIDIAIKLATPIEIPLGGINLLTQQGQNNIYCDTGNTTVEYIKIV